MTPRGHQAGDLQPRAATRSWRVWRCLVLAATILSVAEGFILPFAGQPPSRAMQVPMKATRGVIIDPATVPRIETKIASRPDPQRVYIIGSGAVGLTYGSRLLESGHEVTFLMRRDYDTVREKGLQVLSPDGNLFFSKPSVVRSSEEYESVSQGRAADWVILALKSTSFKEVPQLLGKNVVGPHTRVLVLMNGYGLEKDLSAWVPARQIFGGGAFICSNRGPPDSGVVHHTNYGKVVCGHMLDDPSELQAVGRLWAGAKVEVELAPNLLRARWAKLCWNMPFNGLTTILGGVSVDHVVRTPELRSLSMKVMHDVIRAANAELSLQAPPPDGSQWAIEQSFHDLMYELTDKMGPYMSSTALDLLASNRMEVEYLFTRPLQRAQELGVPVPHMEAVVRTVEGLASVRGLR